MVECLCGSNSLMRFIIEQLIDQIDGFNGSSFSKETSKVLRVSLTYRLTLYLILWRHRIHLRNTWSASGANNQSKLMQIGAPFKQSETGWCQFCWVFDWTFLMVTILTSLEVCARLLSDQSSIFVKNWTHICIFGAFFTTDLGHPVVIAGREKFSQDTPSRPNVNL